MEDLEQTFWQFFTYFPRHVAKWNSCLEQRLSHLKAIQNLSEQFTLIKSNKWNDEHLLRKFPGIEIKLLEKILQGIESEMIEMRKLENSLSSLNKELFRKYDAISKCPKNDLGLTSRGILVPPGWHLIELAEIVKNYYAAIQQFHLKIRYLQFKIVLYNMKYEDESTIVELENVICDLSKISNEVKDVLASTIHCQEQTND